MKKKRKRFSKKDEKISNKLIYSNFQFAELELFFFIVEVQPIFLFNFLKLKGV